VASKLWYFLLPSSEEQVFLHNKWGSESVCQLKNLTGLFKFVHSALLIKVHFCVIFGECYSYSQLPFPMDANELVSMRMNPKNELFRTPQPKIKPRRREGRKEEHRDTQKAGTG
jgi:hypothetical protein